MMEEKVRKNGASIQDCSVHRRLSTLHKCVLHGVRAAIEAIGILKGSRLASGWGLCKGELAKQVGASLLQSAR